MAEERERLRVSDAERQAAAFSLGTAFQDGRLDLLEYDTRLAGAYGAVTYGDLDRLFADLPRPATLAPPQPQYPVYPPPRFVPMSSGRGPVGQVRGTALQILLFVVTFGIWAFVYLFQSHDEMKRHTGDGIGGVMALVVSLFAYMASPYLLSHEVGGLYQRRGQRQPVSALTGLWFFPGIFLLVGPLVWFVLTNNALNRYWRSEGAR
ncbi:DUF1707 domain-containing protein [Blastococcus sp. CT_GayMR16]|uniref:DUF1707 domain-containing protein n=1 Tax=Blastococcus sp. CT_GayMR16 TaxID=2559607 RepID=UPI001FD850D0|nr:DUF1707 domain-containing protein [Blastococcus sp. CT_GayMR16]